MDRAQEHVLSVREVSATLPASTFDERDVARFHADPLGKQPLRQAQGLALTPNRVTELIQISHIPHSDRVAPTS